MTYKKKTGVLLSIIAALALVYICSVVFEPERIGARSDAYTWLDPKLTNQISGISITNAGGAADGGADSGESTELARKNGEWFVSYNEKEYPARQFRVDDFISALVKRASYPVQSLTPSAHERLGVTDSAARLIVRGGAGVPLLDLLVGQPDTTGRNVYLRRQGVNEVRSGENIFSAYLSSARKSWYNLRLFPESESGKLTSANVQRLTVYPSQSGGGGDTQVFTRSGKTWNIGGLSVNNPAADKIDIYVHDILNTEGDDFDYALASADPSLGDSRISLELDDGGIKTIRLAPPDDTGRRAAVVSGSVFVYSLPLWTLNRLFRDAAFFEQE